MISNNVAQGKTGVELIPRSTYPHQLNATLVEHDDDGEVIIDQYENTIVYELPPPRQYSVFSTLDISAAQDGAVMTQQETEVARILAGTSKAHRLGPVNLPLNTAPTTFPRKELSDEEIQIERKVVEDFLALPDESVPLETGGYLANQQNDCKLDSSAYDTFARYVAARTAVMNPGNCNPGVYVQILDAMAKKDTQMALEGRLDERGRPLIKTGTLYTNEATRGKYLQTCFDEAMSSFPQYIGFDSQFEMCVSEEQRIKDEKMRLIEREAETQSPQRSSQGEPSPGAYENGGDDVVADVYSLEPSPFDVLADVASRAPRVTESGNDA